MHTSTIISITSILTSILAQQNCPPGTPKSIAIRGAWRHRWVRCENMEEGGCPKSLLGPYGKPKKGDCEKYLSESGEDYIIDYYFCEEKSKFDQLRPVLEKNGWLCEESE